MKKIVFTCLTFLLISVPAFSADETGRVNLKLVLAKNTPGGGIDAGLKNMKNLLTSNLSYSSYTILGQKTVPLQGTHRIILAEGVTVALSDVQNSSVRIRINKGKKKILETKVNLRKGKPTILGGFSGSKGKMMVIVNLL